LRRSGWKGRFPALPVIFLMMRMWPITLVLLALALPAPAQESYREFESGLHLSNSQKTRVDGIKRKYVGEWRALKEESMRKRLELRELNRPDQRERVQRELDEIQASKQRLFKQYSEEVSSVFSEEQRDRFNKFRDRESRRPMNPPGYRTHER
jgi:hypothetical protein